MGGHTNTHGISVVKLHLVSGFQVLIGFGLFCSSVADLFIGVNGNWSYICTGMWSGLVLMLASSLGISLNEDSKLSRFKMFRLLQILSVVVSICAVVFGSALVVKNAWEYDNWGVDGPGIDIGLFMVTFGVLGTGLSIWALVEYKRKVTNVLATRRATHSYEEASSSTSNEYSNTAYEEN